MAAKKRGLGLGRGLDALLGGDAGPAAAQDTQGELRTLGVDAIQPRKYQPRHTMDPEHLDELAASIRAQGVIQPVVVRAVGRDRYALFARSFNGIELDLDETYAWGWEELYRIEERMREVAARILPGETVIAAAGHPAPAAGRTTGGVAAPRRGHPEKKHGGGDGGEPAETGHDIHDAHMAQLDIAKPGRTGRRRSFGDANTAQVDADDLALRM